MNDKKEKNMNKKIVLTAEFKLIFLTALGLTLVSLVAGFLISFNDPLSPSQTNLFQACLTCWKIGFGSIVGLIGGKSI
ncbi:MAG: hypothetical protein ACTSRG_26110 [Candidatus Helarchaeota archaeon]